LGAIGGDACGNGFDDDGDGEVDNDCTCSPGSTQRCFLGNAALAGVGACSWGLQRCQGGASSEFRSWGPCLEYGATTQEVCRDNVDNNCDGRVDEDCGCREGSRESCTSVCGAGERVCHDGVFSACSARLPSTEYCNGVDDDCDGVIDNIETACSSSCGAGRRRCVAGEWSSCSAPSPTSETCNGADDDCDGVVDDIETSCSTACGSGVRTCEDGEWSSCSAQAPRAEACNLLDDDCDGDVDEGVAADWHFENICDESQIFVAVGGCNTCTEACQGWYVDPGEDLVLEVEQDECIVVSAVADTSQGLVCLDASGGEFVGETRELCNDSCGRGTFTMVARSGC